MWPCWVDTNGGEYVGGRKRVGGLVVDDEVGAGRDAGELWDCVEVMVEEYNACGETRRGSWVCCCSRGGC